MNAESAFARYSRILLGIAWAALLAVLVAVAVDSIVVKPGTDASIYIYVAQGILEGEIPYLDRWDHKGPLLYVLNLCGLLIHGTWGPWLVQGIFLFGASAFAFLALRLAFGTVPAFFAIALLLTLFTPPGNLPGQYGLLFQCLTLYLFVRSQEQSEPAPGGRRLDSLHLAIGALGAASFLLRPNLVTLWLVIGLYWLVARGISWRKLAWAVVGGGTVLILVAGLFLALGAWNALWEAVFLYNIAHSDASLQERLDVLWDLLTRASPVSFLVIAGWGGALVSLTQRRVQDSQLKGLLTVAAALLPLEIMNQTLAGFTYPGSFHYPVTALPVTALLFAFLVWVMAKHLPVPQALVSLALVLGTAFFAVPVDQFGEIAEKYANGVTIGEGKKGILAERIRELSEPEDQILVWGKAARLYLLSDRAAPSRFFYHHALIKPHGLAEAYREEFIADVMKQRPKLIIHSGNPWYASLESAQRRDWQPHPRYAHDLRDFAPFFDFVEQNYIAIEVLEPFVIYGLRSAEPAAPAEAKGELIISSTYDVYLDGRTLTYVKSPCTEDDAANRFILQVIPVDKSVIGGNEHHNMDFNFVEGEDWRIGEGCVVSRELPDYPIAAIRTGQYNASRTGDIWLSEYHLPQSE